MSSVNQYDDHINTYNMIKLTLFKIFIQLRFFKNISNILLIKKINVL